MKLDNQVAAEAIKERAAQLAEALVEREFALHPELAQRYGPIGRQKSLQDAGYHLAYLAQGLAAGSRGLFEDYVAWVKVMLAQRGVLSADLAFHLECTAYVLRECLPKEAGSVAAEYVESALRAMPDMPEVLPTFLHPDEPLAPLAYQYLQALLRGERHVGSRLIMDEVAGGTSVKHIYMHVFQPVQYEIGRLWQENRISVAHEHYCTAATQLVMSQLYPMIFSGEKKDRVLVATCVSGDLHEIGVRMVTDFFEMDGWNTYFLGANMPHADVIRAVVERKAAVLAISATIAYNLGAVEALIGAVRASPDCGAVKILVGGYPFNQNIDLWKSVGADGTAPTAREAIALADLLVAQAG